MRTLFVVDNEALQSLTSITRTAALTEFKRIFDFVGQQPSQAPINVSVLVPSAFPETFDLSDAVVRLTTGSNVRLNIPIHQQYKNVVRGLRAHHLSVDLPDFRLRQSLDPVGAATSYKDVLPTPGGDDLAVVVMAGVVSIPQVASEYAKKKVRVTRQQIDKRRDFTVGKNKLDVHKLARYYGSARSLRDTRFLMILENPTTITEWFSVDQQQIGVALGRAMAHEVRHEIVGTGHARLGLGADSPDVTDDKNYADFSDHDRNVIRKRLNTLEGSQRGAVVVPTFPNASRSTQDFPF